MTGDGERALAATLPREEAQRDMSLSIAARAPLPGAACPCAGGTYAGVWVVTPRWCGAVSRRVWRGLATRRLVIGSRSQYGHHIPYGGRDFWPYELGALAVYVRAETAHDGLEKGGHQ